jgi:uncharacterized protein (TIGR02996 family)
VSDELFEAILNTPDDDAPRLVWADREGGERGELVVIQCALARLGVGGVDAAEQRRLAGRENELLRRATEWASLSDDVANDANDANVANVQPTFVRGFVERVKIPVRVLERTAKDLFTRAPLLRTIDLSELTWDVNKHVGPYPNDSWASAAKSFGAAFAAVPAGRVTCLHATPCVIEEGDGFSSSSTYCYGDELVRLIASLPSLANLRERHLRSCGLTRGAIHHLARLPALVSLLVDQHALWGVGCVELLAALPALREFASSWGTPHLTGAELETFLASPDLSRLTLLDLSQEQLSASERDRVHTHPALASSEVLV